MAVRRLVTGATPLSVKIAHLYTSLRLKPPSFRQYTSLSPPFYLPKGPGIFQKGLCESVAGSCVGVAEFKVHWEQVLKEHRVPEGEWSVKWIVEHVQRVEGNNKDHYGVYLSPNQITMATDMMNQRLKRIPVQYLIGEWDFRNVTLKMSPPVFVPTAETEELVGLVIKHCYDVTSISPPPPPRPPRPPPLPRPCPDVVHFLDLCCGSGAIAVSLLHECPKARVVAVDLSSAAVELTQQNAKKNGVSERLTVHKMSVMKSHQFFEESGIKFDCIVSNPPYVTMKEMAVLEPEIHKFMDHRSLNGGVNGLNTAIEILSTCRHYLQPHGEIWLEMGHRHQTDIYELINQNPEWNLKYESHYFDFNQRSRFHQLKMIAQQ